MPLLDRISELETFIKDKVNLYIVDMKVRENDNETFNSFIREARATAGCGKGEVEHEARYEG